MNAARSAASSTGLRLTLGPALRRADRAQPLQLVLRAQLLFLQTAPLDLLFRAIRSVKEEKARLVNKESFRP